MKKILTFLCCLGIIISSVLFGGAMFCENIVSHSLVNTAIDQIHLEEKLNEILSVIDLPDAQANSELITEMIEDIVNDDEIIEEINKYTDSFISDLVNDETTEVTSNLNQVVKNKVISYSSDISALSNHMVSEDVISQILSESVDIADVQGLYDNMITQMKSQFSPTQKLLIKCISFMQSDLCYYGSLVAMIVFTVLIFIMNLAWLSGLVQIAVSWLLSAIVMFAISKIIPVILSMIFSDNALSAGLSDNVAQLTKLSAIYFAIFVVCTIAKIIYNRFFIKD